MDIQIIGKVISILFAVDFLYQKFIVVVDNYIQVPIMTFILIEPLKLKSGKEIKNLITQILAPQY